MATLDEINGRMGRGNGTFSRRRYSESLDDAFRQQKQSVYDGLGAVGNRELIVI